MPGWLWVAHPGVEQPALVTRDAHRELWQPKGWEPVDVDLAAASRRLGTTVTDASMLPASYVTGLVAGSRADIQAAEPAPAAAHEAAPPHRRTAAKKEA